MFGMKKKQKENEKLEASKAFAVVDGQRVPLKTLLNAKAAEEGIELSHEETIVIDGQEVSVADLVTSYQNGKKKKDKKEKENIDQDEVENADGDGDADDKENTDADGDDDGDEKENTAIITKQKISKTKADSKKKMKKEDDDKEEAEEDTKEHDKADEETLEKKNMKHFGRLNAARETMNADEPVDDYPDTMAGRVARGNSRYSSVKK